MRTLFSQTIAATRPATEGTWLPGLPHVLAASCSWLVFGGAACAAGLLLASFVSFVLWLPLVALALNNGAPLMPEAAAPALTPNAKRALFLLWTVSAWLAAALAR